MKSAAPLNLTQVTWVVRLSAGLLALLSTLALSTAWLQSAHGQALLAYQSLGMLISVSGFILTFEQHFHQYWHIEAALFFYLSLLIGSGMGLVLDNPIPLTAFIVGVPIVTVLLPWDWQFQLGICALCVGSAYH